MVIENLVQTRHRLLGRGREDEDRHVVHTELHQHRLGSSVWKRGGNHVEFVADMVHGLIDIDSVMEFKIDDRDIVS